MASGRVSVSSTTDEIANSRNVLFSPRANSTTSIGLEDMEVFTASELCSLSEDEKGFLEAVRQSDEEKVKKYIVEKNVDANCKDSGGETALQIAVEAKDSKIISILLKHRAETGNALFQAVRNGCLQCVRLLVAHDTNRKTSTAMPPGRTSGTTGRSGSGKFDEFLTPLTLAVLNADHKIVEFLLSKGYKVEKPDLAQKTHKTSTGTEKESMTMSSLKDSVVKLNTNRALASPLYLSYSFLQESKQWGTKATPSDPIFGAIILKKKLEDLAEIEDEFRDDYLALSAQCEDFAIRLLNECRNLEEIAAVMEMPDLDEMSEGHLRGRERRLRVLQFAIKCHNRKFLAHPYSQVMLNSAVYRGARGWHHLKLPIKLFLVTLYTFVMPLCMLGYILLPKNRFTKKFEIPLVKLTNQSCSVVWFLLLVSLSAFQDKYDTFFHLSPLNVFIAIWVVGITVQEVKHVFHQGIERYLSQWWHLAVIPMIVFYIIAAVLWLVGFAFIAMDAGSWTVHVREILGSTSLAPYQLILLSNSFYSFALVLTFFEASHVLQVNSTMGPLHLSLMNMGKDIFKFFVLFALNFLAFALAMRKLYSQHVQTTGRLASGNNNGTTAHEFERIEGTFSTLFWALFGHVDFAEFKTSEDSEITSTTGELLFASYSLASVLVALNMLIAMLSNTFQTVADERDIMFKFTRTRIWMYYVSEVSPLPPPFNLIPVERFGAALRWLANRYNWIGKRRAVIKSLIHRYFSEIKAPGEKEDELDEQHSQSDIKLKLKEVETSIQGLQNTLKSLQQLITKQEQKGSDSDATGQDSLITDEAENDITTLM